jgi:hypothetical protein
MTIAPMMWRCDWYHRLKVCGGLCEKVAYGYAA